MNLRTEGKISEMAGIMKRKMKDKKLKSEVFGQKGTVTAEVRRDGS